MKKQLEQQLKELKMQQSAVLAHNKAAFYDYLRIIEKAINNKLKEYAKQ